MTHQIHVMLEQIFYHHYYCVMMVFCYLKSKRQTFAFVGLDLALWTQLAVRVTVLRSAREGRSSAVQSVGWIRSLQCLLPARRGQFVMALARSKQDSAFLSPCFFFQLLYEPVIVFICVTHFVPFPQAQYNVTLTSQTNADQVLQQILDVLPGKNVTFVQKGQAIYFYFFLISPKTEPPKLSLVSISFQLRTTYN